MSFYFTLDSLKAKIPLAFLTEALDDDGDGVIDAFDQVRTDVQDFIDGLLSVRYPTPFDPAPKVVTTAAVVLTAESCYKRRGVKDEENPWFSQAGDMRKLLTSIAKGDIQLQATGAVAEPVQPAGSIVSYESKLGAPGRFLG